MPRVYNSTVPPAPLLDTLSTVATLEKVSRKQKKEVSSDGRETKKHKILKTATLFLQKPSDQESNDVVLYSNSKRTRSWSPFAFPSSGSNSPEITPFNDSSLDENESIKKSSSSSSSLSQSSTVIASHDDEGVDDDSEQEHPQTDYTIPSTSSSTTKRSSSSSSPSFTHTNTETKTNNASSSSLSATETKPNNVMKKDRTIYRYTIKLLKMGLYTRALEKNKEFYAQRKIPKTLEKKIKQAHILPLLLQAGALFGKAREENQEAETIETSLIQAKEVCKQIKDLKKREISKVLFKNGKMEAINYILGLAKAPITQSLDFTCLRGFERKEK